MYTFISNKFSLTGSALLLAALWTHSSSSMAQGVNISNPNVNVNVNGNSGINRPEINVNTPSLLDEIAARRNLAGSCDSTCNGEMGAPPVSTAPTLTTTLEAPINTFENRFVMCQAAGYASNYQGSITQRRNIVTYKGQLYKTDPWVTQSDTCAAPPPAAAVFEGVVMLNVPCDAGVIYPITAVVSSNNSVTFSMNGTHIGGNDQQNTYIPYVDTCTAPLINGSGSCTLTNPMGYVANGSLFAATYPPIRIENQNIYGFGWSTNTALCR